MSAPRHTDRRPVQIHPAGSPSPARPDSLEFIREEPLLIRVEDRPYTVTLRTPGQEKAQVAGLCLGEGLVDSPEDIHNIGHDQSLDPNTVDVWLAPGRREKVADLLGRRTFLSQTSCGLCGKELIRDIQVRVTPAGEGPRVDLDLLRRGFDRLEERQEIHRATRSAHAALILDARGGPVSFAEDVGRHNALDKAIGRALLSGKLPAADILVLSSRISYELVQKAARAGLSILVAFSRPTALALDLGESLKLTLCFAAGPDLVVACGKERIVQDP